MADHLLSNTLKKERRRERKGYFRLSTSIYHNGWYKGEARKMLLA
jgi:hypothetical protein